MVERVFNTGMDGGDSWYRCFYGTTFGDFIRSSLYPFRSDIVIRGRIDE